MPLTKDKYFELIDSNSDYPHFRCALGAYIPGSLYKYFSIPDDSDEARKRFEQLKSGEIWFSKRSGLNDPFEFEHIALKGAQNDARQYYLNKQQELEVCCFSALLYLEENYGLTSEKKVQSAIKIVANENRYHPVRDYLNSLQWDGTERIRYALHHFLGADTDEYTFEALKLFMMGAIRRVFQPGSKFEVMLCLVGGQGAGKSTFFRLLAVRDEWFSDDLKKLDDENVYRKLQGHWIMEMSEMIATANARSIEEIKSFLSRQKETYKVPYETHPADRLRQCVFGGTTNRQDFLPRDRTGNRRFLPVTVYPERAEVHILDDEAAARAYIEQMWAEAMTVYRSGKYKLSFSMEMNRYLNAHQQDFMQEDTQAGMIYAYLEDYTGDRVCSKQLYEEALGNLNSPADWETRAICEIMNTGIAGGIIQGWVAYKSPKRYKKYGSQKGWERVNQAPPEGDGFQEITEEEARQMELPF